jgi:hypothetical protein
MTSVVFASTATIAHGPVLRTVRPGAGAFGVLARWPSGSPRGHTASEPGGDVPVEARRTENESTMGCRADLVDNGLIQCVAEQGPIGLAARISAAAEPNEWVARFDQMARLASSVDPVTRPPLWPGMARHAGAAGIELDGVIASEPIAFRLGEAGAEAPFPQRAAAPAGPVHVLDMALPRMLHQPRAATGPLQRQQQVHVIGHETGGVDRARELRGPGLKVCEIKFVVGIGEEAGAAIVAALNYVDWHLGDGDPRAVGHGGSGDGDSAQA